MNYGKRGVRRRQQAVSAKATKFKKMLIVTLLKALLVCFITSIILAASLVIGGFRGILDSTPNITISDVIPSGVASVVYDNEGHEMVKLVAEGSNRVPVTMDMIPENLAHAFVAIEDARFYEHNGIDIKGIMRAGIGGIRNGFHFTSGASTITQQLLKNNVFDNWVTESSFIESLKRKIQEQYLAIQLEKVMSKDEILEQYMNTINLGHSTLGVQAASLRYFNKSVYELNLSECAVIAAITQNPSYYDPIIYPEHNAERRMKVLNNMLEQEWITQAEYDEALADDVYSRIQVVNANIVDSSIYTYFEDALIAEVEADLQAAGYSRTQALNLLYSGGLSIYSTQDSQIQAIVDSVFNNEENYPAHVQYLLSYQLTLLLADGTYSVYTQNHIDSYFKQTNPRFDLLFDNEEDAYAAVEAFKETLTITEDELVSEVISVVPQPQASMTIEDQSTGYVLAMIGGRGNKEGSRSFNRAYSSTRSPGSTFKILAAYSPAIDNGIKTLSSVYNDAPFNYDNGTPVRNYDQSYRGLCRVRYAIEQSLNIIAVKTVTVVTPQLAYDYLINYGFTTLEYMTDDGLSDIHQAIALGGLTHGVYNYELNAAYAAIANNGRYIEPVFYTRVVDSNGNVILDNTVNREGRQVIKETTAFLLTSAMEGVLTSGTGGAANFSGQAIAGKTGTSSNYVDVWFAGFTPYYTATVWVGIDNNATLNTSDERNLAKRLWRLTMSQIHENLPYQSFIMPNGITTATVCSRSGKVPIAGLCDATLVTEYYETGTEPTDICDVHYSGWVCAVDNLPANEGCPFAVAGILELIPVEEEVLARGSTIINADGTVTTANMTNQCQHNTEFYAAPEADALIQQQWGALSPEMRQAILDSGASDFFRGLYGPQTPDEGEGGTPPDGQTVIVPPPGE